MKRLNVRPGQRVSSTRSRRRRRQTCQGNPFIPATFIPATGTQEEEAGVSAAGSHCPRALSENTSDASDKTCLRALSSRESRAEHASKLRTECRRTTTLVRHIVVSC